MKAPNSSQKRSTLITVLCLAMATLFYQNCSKVDFQSDESVVAFTCRTQGCFEGTINPDVDVVRPPVKVALIVDNSFSMEAAQSYLSEGVKTLIEDLKGFAAEYRVYTTTQYGNKQVAQESAYCIETKSDGTITESPSCPPKVIGAKYEYGTRVRLAASLTPGTNFQITENANETDFANLKSRLSDAIKAVGTSGNDTEQGTCTLNRLVYEQGPNKIFNPGDTAIFALITDENDSSSGTSCLSTKNRVREECNGTIPPTLKKRTTYEIKLAAKTTINRDVKFNWRRKNISRKFKYNTQKWTQSIYYTYQPNPVDGRPLPIDTTYWSTPRTRDVWASCSTTRVACDSSAISAVKSWTGNISPTSCEMSCSNTASVVSSTVTKSFALDKASLYCGTTVTEANCSQAIGAGGIQGYVASSCEGLARPTGYPLSALDPSLLTGCFRDPENMAQTVTKTLTTAECSTAVTTEDNTTVTNFLNNNTGELTPGASISVVCGTPTSLPEELKTIALVETVPNVDATPDDYCSTNFVAISTEATKLFSGRILATNYCVQKAFDTALYYVNGTAYNSDPLLPQCTVTESAKNFSFPPENVASANVDLNNSFVLAADQLFGKTYLLSALLHDKGDDPSCIINSGQSVGTRYMDLIGLSQAITGFKGVTGSICSADYGVALAPAAAWAKDIIGNTYVASQIDTAKGQGILKVWLTRGGVRVDLSASDVSFAGNSVTFSEGVLQKGDEIHFLATK